MAPHEPLIALAGNPNVGKSTLFNQLTGLKQHTGNWTGKTVELAEGHFLYRGTRCRVVDLPGTYSLLAHSREEAVARDFLCFGGADAVAVICDATCPERGIRLALQIAELCPRVICCVNLLDEAQKKHIRVDLHALSERLGMPVCGTTARSKRGIGSFKETVLAACQDMPQAAYPRYSAGIEQAIAALTPTVTAITHGQISPRFTALRLLEGDDDICGSIVQTLGCPALTEQDTRDAVAHAREQLPADMTSSQLCDEVTASAVRYAEAICRETFHTQQDGFARDRAIDRLLTGKYTGLPIMLLLLGLVLWITVAGANVPSQWLSDGFAWLGEQLSALLIWLHTPDWLYSLLLDGIYCVLSWVVAVMLPPMAIFFPLFTLLEDLGYLPRIAFNLDRYFQQSHACGKQALCMCMGLGCNAVGITGCRIIDSPRERLLAMLTNNFMPCNGRFPTMLTLTGIFLIGSAGGLLGTTLSAAALVGMIVLGVAVTLLCCRVLSGTLLRGLPSSFTLELPPYRRPQIGKILVRSMLDRTLRVLGRAVYVAAPAGLIIWLMANISVGGASLLTHTAGFLDPFGRLLGMDGIMLTAFLLGFPANEIVLPIALMGYMAQSSLVEANSLAEIGTLLTQNGWTAVTAICVLLFSLMHWPCSTTCLTMFKETHSIKWTLWAVLTPTLCGMSICMLVNAVAWCFGC